MIAVSQNHSARKTLEYARSHHNPAAKHPMCPSHFRQEAWKWKYWHLQKASDKIFLCQINIFIIGLVINKNGIGITVTPYSFASLCVIPLLLSVTIATLLILAFSSYNVSERSLMFFLKLITSCSYSSFINSEWIIKSADARLFAIGIS